MTSHSKTHPLAGAGHGTPQGGARKNGKPGDPLTVAQQFSMLSLKDLVEARDHYHVHLMHKKENVVAAVGAVSGAQDHPGHGCIREPGLQDGPRRRTRARELWQFGRSGPTPGRACSFLSRRGSSPTNSATLRNPTRTTWSRGPSTCPTAGSSRTAWSRSTESLRTPARIRSLTFPENLIGGGYPVLLVDVQGQEHVASVGCLVAARRPPRVRPDEPSCRRPAGRAGLLDPRGPEG